MPAGSADFEQVAEWLWRAELPESARWEADQRAAALARAALAPLPATALPLDRLRVAVAALAVADELRYDTRPAAVVAAGRTLIATLVEALPRLDAAPGQPSAAGDAGDPERLAARLWPRLCPRPPAPGWVDLLNAALGLLADHELSASTLAARIAASLRADPYAVVGAGLAAVGGPLQAGAALGAEALLERVAREGDAARVIGDYLRRGEQEPGFGHPIYREADPRAIYLLDRLRAVAPADRLATVEAVLEVMRRRTWRVPNIEFALAALTHAGGLGGAAEAIFALARVAGWIAHALEEYERGTSFRLRALYIGARGSTD